MQHAGQTGRGRGFAVRFLSALAPVALAIGGSAILLPSRASADSPDAELALASPASRGTESLLGPRAVALEDIDRDGSLDAVAVGYANARYASYAGVGDGSFGEELAQGPLYLKPVDLVVGDFNGDGLPDIAAINSACST
jgi:hypothetical protein